MQHHNEIHLVDKIKNTFKKPRVIRVGDVGIYQDVLTVNTINDGTHSLYYDIYAKVKALAIYENLVEIEVLDVVTLNSCNQEIKSIIDTNMPKYIHPKYIKWEIKL